MAPPTHRQTCSSERTHRKLEQKKRKEPKALLVMAYGKEKTGAESKLFRSLEGQRGARLRIDEAPKAER